MIIYDFANLLVIIVLILLLFRLGLIPLWLSFFLALFAFVPFFLNDVLFSAMFMSDQFGYLACQRSELCHSVLFARSFDDQTPHYLPCKILYFQDNTLTYISVEIARFGVA